VLLNLTINETGKVRDCYLIRGSDIPGKQKAVDMMKNTSWAPASRDYSPIRSYLRVLVE
jgi:hypothetical protein